MRASPIRPEATPVAAWARLRQRFPGAVEGPPPPEVERVVERVLGLLAGGRDDLADVALDVSGVSPFNLRVYEIARAIAPGQTCTYGQVARAMGEPGAARAAYDSMSITVAWGWSSSKNSRTSITRLANLALFDPFIAMCLPVLFL